MLLLKKTKSSCDSLTRSAKGWTCSVMNSNQGDSDLGPELVADPTGSGNWIFQSVQFPHDWRYFDVKYCRVSSWPWDGSGLFFNIFFQGGENNTKNGQTKKGIWIILCYVKCRPI